MLHAMQLSLQLGTVRENRKRPIDCCNCSDSILKVNCQIFEAWRHYDPGCFRVHHEAADRHICLQFLGSVFVQMSWTQSNDTLRFIVYFQLRPQFVHSGGVLLRPFDITRTAQNVLRDMAMDWVNEQQVSAIDRRERAHDVARRPWKADARATCLGAIQWCNLCCPVVFWNWCWAICHHTCLILVFGLFQWHVPDMWHEFLS